MKKLFVAAGMLLFASCGFAQTYSHSSSADNGIVFGIRGAFNLSREVSSSSSSNPSMTTNRTSSSGSLPGFAAGFFLEAPLSREFSIQPEIDYSLKGRKATNNINGGSYTFKENLGYIAVPVLFKYKPAAVKGLNIFAGPEFGFLASAKDRGTTNSGNYSSSSTTDVSSEFKKFDLGLDIGAGYDFIPNLGIDVRYGFGLTNISKNLGTSSVNGTTYASSLKNGTFQIGLRYLFRN